MITHEGRVARLRPLRASDRERTLSWRNDPEIRDNALGYRFPVTEVMEEKWIAHALDDQSRTRVIFAIEDRKDGRLVGLIYLTEIDWISRVASFGIMIGDKARQGRGIATDAMHLILRYAFSCLNLRKICLRVADYNTRAQALYDRLGFAVEGRLRQHVYLEDTFHDVILMALFRDDYLRPPAVRPRRRVTRRAR